MDAGPESSGSPRNVRGRVGPEAVESEGAGIGVVVHDHVDSDPLPLSSRLARFGVCGGSRNERRPDHDRE